MRYYMELNRRVPVEKVGTSGQWPEVAVLHPGSAQRPRVNTQGRSRTR